jgi:outer membrane protein assembly factor BamB
MTRTLRSAARLGLVAVALLLLALEGGPLARGSVSALLQLRPGLGPPTTPFTATGKRFGPSELVDITFDATLVGTTTTSPTGVFSKKVRVPSAALPGNHTVTATGETSGQSAEATFLVRTNWPRFHFDNANTGFNPYENVISTSNVSTLVQRWAVPTIDGGAPDPIVAYGRVYVAPTDGVVRALDPATGTLLWSYDTGGTMSGTAPTAAGNLIYIGNDNGVVLALSVSTGLPVWTRDIGSEVIGSPVAGGSAVYVGNESTIYALDASTGTLKWRAGLSGHSPTLAYGLLYTEAQFACIVQARDAATGHFVWTDEFCSEADVSMTTAAADGLVFDASVGVHALVGTTGEVVWSSAIDLGPGPMPVSVADGVVYISSWGSSGFLTAINESDGTLLWQTASFDPSLSTPAVANGVVYLGDDEGRFRAFNAATGSVLWTSPTAAVAFDGNVAVSDGMVFTSTEDGTVYAFGLP